MSANLRMTSPVNRLRGSLPKIGIRPTIDGRLGGVRESLEGQTMGMARRVAELITANVRHASGLPVEVVVSETTMSRAHAAIGYDGKRFFVQDLGSTNGTKLNGERAERAELTRGDLVLLGKLLLEVVLP